MTVTYSGATAASTGRNPPCCLWRGGVAGRVQYAGDSTTKAFGAKIWLYSSTNGSSDVQRQANAGWITDGGILGMTPGDVLIGVMNGGAQTANLSTALVWMGPLNSTESTLSTAAYGVTSSPTTSQMQ